MRKVLIISNKFLINERNIGMISEFLITGLFQNDGSVVLAVPDKKVDNGLKLA